MKKIIFAVGLIIVLAVVGTPLISGFIMERIVKQSFSDINKMYAETGSDISVEISRYDRKFSSSQIEWKLKLGPALKAFDGVEEIIFVDQADHGFLSVVSKTSLEKNKWFTEFVNDNLSGKSPLEIKTEYKISGDINSTLTLNAFSFKDGGNVIQIMPGQMIISLDKGLNNILSEMIWTGCQVPGKIKVDRFSFNSKMKKITPAIWDSNSSFLVKDIQADNGKSHFGMANLKCDFTSNFDKKANAVSIGMEYGIDHIKSGQSNIRNAFIKIGLNRIDARGYEDFIRLYSQVINDAMEKISASQEYPAIRKKAVEEQMAAIGLQMAGAYEKLLKKGFEIQISGLKAQLPQGDIKGDARLSLKKDMTLVQFAPILMQPAAALDIFSLKSDISLPYKLVGENPMLISPVYSGMQTGLFIKDRDVLTHQAETREGKLFLNGKEVLLN